MPLSEFRKWGATDRALAVALTSYEDDLCPDCGQPKHLSMDPANENKWVSPDPHRCHACTAIEVKSRPYAGREGASALKFHAELHGATPPAQ